MADAAIIEPDLGGSLLLVGKGKVRHLYGIDSDTLLFVATDRISVYDVVLANVRPQRQ